ncbi:mitotic-spindle organizing protein 2-like isoform 1-T1 [Ammospiza maritima maritima]
MSEGPAGMAVPAAMAETRLRRKQLLSAEEAELFELAQAAGSGLDPEVFRVLLDLLRMNVAPLAVFQVLKSMCAGQRLPPAAESGPAAPAPIPADSRGTRRAGAERGGRGPSPGSSRAEPPEHGRSPPAPGPALRPLRPGTRLALPRARAAAGRGPRAARPSPGGGSARGARSV